MQRQVVRICVPIEDRNGRLLGMVGGQRSCGHFDGNVIPTVKAHDTTCGGRRPRDCSWGYQQRTGKRVAEHLFGSSTWQAVARRATKSSGRRRSCAQVHGRCEIGCGAPRHSRGDRRVYLPSRQEALAGRNGGVVDTARRRRIHRLRRPVASSIKSSIERRVGRTDSFAHSSLLAL